MINCSHCVRFDVFSTFLKARLLQICTFIAIAFAFMGGLAASAQTVENMAPAPNERVAPKEPLAASNGSFSHSIDIKIPKFRCCCG